MITPEMDPRADDAGLELLGETAIETAVETLISPIVPVMEPLEGSLMDGMFPLLAPIMTLSQTMELFWHRVDALTDARGVTREVPLNPAEVTRRQSLVDAHAARAYSMQQAVAEQVMGPYAHTDAITYPIASTAQMEFDRLGKRYSPKAIKLFVKGITLEPWDPAGKKPWKVHKTLTENAMIMHEVMDVISKDKEYLLLNGKPPLTERQFQEKDKKAKLLLTATFQEGIGYNILAAARKNPTLTAREWWKLLDDRFSTHSPHTLSMLKRQFMVMKMPKHCNPLDFITQMELMKADIEECGYRMLNSEFFHQILMGFGNCYEHQVMDLTGRMVGSPPLSLPTIKRTMLTRYDFLVSTGIIRVKLARSGYSWATQPSNTADLGEDEGDDYHDYMDESASTMNRPTYAEDWTDDRQNCSHRSDAPTMRSGTAVRHAIADYRETDK